VQEPRNVCLKTLRFRGGGPRFGRRCGVCIQGCLLKLGSLNFPPACADARSYRAQGGAFQGESGREAYEGQISGPSRAVAAADDRGIRAKRLVMYVLPQAETPRSAAAAASTLLLEGKPKKRRTDWEGARRSAGLRGLVGFATASGGWGAKSPDTSQTAPSRLPPCMAGALGARLTQMRHYQGNRNATVSVREI